MDIIKRFLSYVSIDTTSQESESCPSTPNQLLLAHQLEKELKELGAVDVTVDENGFVYGTVKGNVEGDYPKVGYLAHMDTSAATSGSNIKARVIENYDGKDIILSEGIKTTLKEYPQIARHTGKTIIVTDGKTLLGGDDKAGIAIIMEMVAYYAKHPEERHAEFRVCFTPDEETGGGISHINKELLNCDYAYTLDGGNIEEVAYENFNAASAVVLFYGNSIHPGSAKGKMINASLLAMEFNSLLPVFERPEYTEGREGFNHLVEISGDCQNARSVYIIRNHDEKKFEKQKHQFELITMHMNEMYGQNVVELKLRDSYRNMKQCFEGKMEIINNAVEALKQQGIEPVFEAVRGGTDGAQLSYMGIPTPNLGTGDMFCHGNHELVCADDMRKMVDVCVGINRRVVEK